MLGEKIPPGIAMAIGTGVHKAADLNHKQKIETGLDLPLSDIKDAASDGFYEAVETDGVYFTGSSQELKKELGAALDQSVNMAGVYGEKVAPEIMPIESELKISMQHPDLPVPFLGIVDVIDVKSAPKIIDLKTARVKWRAGKEKESLQPIFYNWLVKSHFKQSRNGLGENSFQAIKKWDSENFISSNQEMGFAFKIITAKGEAQIVDVAPKESEIGYVVRLAEGLLNAIQNDCFPPAVPGHWICSENWCGFYKTCLARK